MTAKEYLNQARHLDALINCRLREINYWRDLSSSVSGSNFEQHYNPNKPTEAPFVRCLEKIDAARSGGEGCGRGEGWCVVFFGVCVCCWGEAVDATIE